MKTFFAETALTPEGWARDVLISITAEGDIAGCTANAGADGAERLRGAVVPGMPNLHSHAFQRAMAGLTEHSSGAADSFWTWRETMYRFLSRLGPEDVEAIAAQLYVEMLKAGYTAVGEFHYLHHDPEGRPYADRATMAEAVLAAASSTGIGMTMLPVLYQVGGFDGRALGPEQRRFANTADEFLDLWSALSRRHHQDQQIRLGVAFHSLRAVEARALAALSREFNDIDLCAPRHIHVAEQLREVEECLAARGCRPVEWLLDNIGLDSYWCLVHATHMTESEVRHLAKSGAVAGLCPTTEANLGDGFFAMPEFLDAGGSFGIGSDSHISVNPIEELRWLEYGRRLLARRRNLATSGRPGSTGAALWRKAVEGGGFALGRHVCGLALGGRADLVVLDDAAPSLYGRSGDALVDSLVFAADTRAVRDVMVGGRWVVRDGRHDGEEKIFAAYKTTIDKLKE